MSLYPRNATERATIRDVIRRSVMERAEREANSMGRSTRCALGDHYRHEDVPGFVGFTGCANTGESCICECHDGGARIKEIRG